MENNQITIETVLNEYNKYIISRLIEKEYNFEDLRNKVKILSEKTELIEYNEEQTNKEVAENVKELIEKSIYGKKVEIK